MSKKLLLAVFLLLPFCSFAGSFNLSLGGGFIPKSGEYPQVYIFDGYYGKQEKPTLTGLTGTVKGIWTFKHFEFGIGMDLGSMQRAGTITKTPFGYQGDGLGVLYASKFVSPVVLANINIPFSKKFSLYTGITAGVLFSIGTSAYKGYGTFMTIESDRNGQLIGSDFKGKEKLIMFGVQAGLRYKLNNRFAAYGEIAPRFAFNGLEHYPYYKYNIIYFPLTIGVSCRVSKN